MGLRLVTITCETCGTAFQYHNGRPGDPRLRRFCGKRCATRATAKRRSDALVRDLHLRMDKTDTCWLWTGSLMTGGKPGVKWKGKQWRVSRLVWTLANGPIPDGVYVCHHCDNTLCVRLDHLFLGTAQDNMNDCIAKGRRPQPTNKRLYEGDIEKIKNLYVADGLSYAEIGRRFDITRTHARRVCLEQPLYVRRNGPSVALPTEIGRGLGPR